MTVDKTKKTIVIGHKNPDTDSICSAICYANLKQITSGGEYVPGRAGHVNSENQFVLDYFGMAAPKETQTVKTQVKDIEIRETKGVAKNISLKKAWNLMQDAGVVTIPAVTEDNVLEGLITVGDITRSYMNVYDSSILSKACTQYTNIIETLEGAMLIGDEREYFKEGKVLIAAANPDMMEYYIEKHDLVILGNRYESQLCAIEMEAGCIIVCEGAGVSMTIKKLAQERGCTVITTPYDTYTAARLINQSMPISFFMKTENLITFDTDDYIDDIKEVMASKRHRENANILEIIDHHRLGTVETMGPVFFRNQPLGCTATIIYQMYKEAGVTIENKIAGLLCSAIISDTLLFRSPTCTPVDKDAAMKLAAIAGIDVEQLANKMFAAGSKLKGKSDAEIFYQDFKRFTAGKIAFGVGQITSLNAGELNELKSRMLTYMDRAREDEKVDMMFFMLTNILTESTELICDGQGAKQLAGEAFHLGDEEMDKEEHIVSLPGVVSRKKQLVPGLMVATEQ